MYIKIDYLLCMIKVMVGGVLVICEERYNLGKLIGLLLFCLSLLSINVHT